MPWKDAQPKLGSAVLILVHKLNFARHGYTCWQAKIRLYSLCAGVWGREFQGPV